MRGREGTREQGRKRKREGEYNSKPNPNAAPKTTGSSSLGNEDTYGILSDSLQKGLQYKEQIGPYGNLGLGNTWGNYPYARVVKVRAMTLRALTI